MLLLTYVKTFSTSIVLTVSNEGAGKMYNSLHFKVFDPPFCGLNSRFSSLLVFPRTKNFIMFLCVHLFTLKKFFGVAWLPPTLFQFYAWWSTEVMDFLDDFAWHAYSGNKYIEKFGASYTTQNTIAVCFTFYASDESLANSLGGYSFFQKRSFLQSLVLAHDCIFVKFPRNIVLKGLGCSERWRRDSKKTLSILR